MNIDSGDARLVLLCPAWKKWGTARTVKPGTVILHSRADDVVPFADSEELVRNSGLPASALIEVGTDHRLADPEPLEAMLEACESGDPETEREEMDMDEIPAFYLEPTHDSGRAFVMHNLSVLSSCSIYCGSARLPTIQRLLNSLHNCRFMALKPSISTSITLFRIFITPVAKCFFSALGVLLIGPPTERWDKVLLVRHQSAQTFLSFASNKGYMAGIGHRLAALVDSRLLPIIEDGKQGRPTTS